MRINILREKYCKKCPIVKRSKRSTGVKFLLEITNVENLRVLDYGCSNWRNTTYLESLGATSLKIDATPHTKPDIVAYPTHMPIRDKAVDITLFTHIFMFLEDKAHWPTAAQELQRITKRYIVVETYTVKNSAALKYQPEEIIKLFYNIKKKYVRKDLQVFIISQMGQKQDRGEASRDDFTTA